ncbi:Odorant receptor 46a, isoform A [Trachymyrmex cornetzi]|uniref:Odorant receptor 46a, isoform A n=1 Tax=Trachymyrmex cornetzi TaxID=471704 RepID=A0A151JSA2_9HYME|nr:Odorant receptor 46a, isoform A [Trachymyrmex cornetzi]
MFISQISGFLVLIGPLMTQNERQLPMKMYVPYSMVELLPYLLTYLEQVAVVLYGVSLNVAFDSLVYGFIIHTCGQIELLCYRLSETFRFLQENDKEKEHDVIEKFAIAECVRHHVSVCNITYRIQSLFMWIITILFFFSLITLCSSVYQISNKNFFSVEFFGFLVYLGAMLFQVFSYCWYGNELDLKNKSIAHAIYASDWTVISAKQRKSLSFMMMMSQVRNNERETIYSDRSGIMDILPLNFRVLWFCGAWSEKKDNNGLFIRFLSSCYRYAIVILIYEFTISEVIELVRTHDDIEGITEGLFLALTYVALCFKYGNFLVRQNEVSMLLDCFRRETCQPRNSEERMILIKYDRKAKWCVRTFMSISQATCIALILAPIVGPQNTDRPLPFKTYLPYSISGLYPYLATYLQHVGAIFYGVLLNVSFDSLVYGFTLHVCGQIELLCYRLYTIFLLIYEFTILDVIEVIRTRDHIQELTEGLFMGLTFLTLCVKYANFLLRGNELSDLLNCLRVKICQPRNSIEKLIIEEHSRRAKWSTMSFLMISYVTGLGFIITPALGLLKGGERVLPLKTYIPYSVSNLLPYLATYLQQFLAVFYAIMLNVNFDCLVYGFTIQACAQIDLMCSRLTDSLKNIGDISSGRKPETNALIVECVKHHLLVSNLKKLFSFEFLSMFLYLSGMLLQLFYYCWYAIFLLIYEFTIFDVIEVIRTRDHVQELTEGLFLGLTFLTLCVKYANFLLRESELSDLLDSLRVKMCQPRNSMEKLIIEQHSRRAKWSSILFMMISYMTGFGFMVTPALELLKGGKRVLPLKTYIPYSVSNLLLYLATYLQQFLTLFYGIMLNVTFDCLVYGFTIQVCAQIELMCCRLTDSLKNSGRISSGQNRETSASIVECVKHHLLKKLLSFEFFSMFMYLNGMLLQLFYYCWYGNELELKSKDIATAVYSCDWTMVTPRERRSLMLIMISSQKGIMFSYHGVFALSLNTFTWVSK